MSAGLRNLQSFEKSVGRAKARAEGKVTRRYQEFVAKILKELAANTPQWSGDLAASWEVVVGKDTPASQFGHTDLKQTPPVPRALAKFKGDKAAVEEALQRNAFILLTIRWNSNVRIVNNNPTQYVPGFNEGRLRRGNFIPGDLMAAAYVASRYSTGRTQLKLV